MGEVLWSPTYQFSPDFSYDRQYFLGVFLGWQPGSTILELGNPFVVQEHIFGGYIVVLEFADYFWQWSSSSFHVPKILENLYAIPPFPSPHVSVGATLVSIGYSQAVGYWWLNFQLGIVGEYYANPFPPMPVDYWMWPYGSPI